MPALLAAALLASVPLASVPLAAAAQDYQDGRAAYAAGDWSAAQSLWREAAEAGSAEAMLGLGNILDFGLTGAQQPEKAFALYLKAARLGLSEAAFNVAVMHDSGVGTARDMRSAAAWYSFAALGGHARAGYNLGRLFADGDGVTENPALAAYWTGRAAEAIPAAADALDALAPPEGGDLAAPDPLAAGVFATGSGPEARLAWQDSAGPPDGAYTVQMIRLLPDGPAPMARADTEGSAVAVAMPDAETDFAWRVAQVAGGGAGYAASAWQSGSGQALDTPPIGAVRFEYGPEDRRAEGLALRIGGAMARSGAIVSYAATDTRPPTSSATYRYPQDSGFAANVAAFLPGLSAEGAQRAAASDIAPGEVRVALAFGESDG